MSSGPLIFSTSLQVTKMGLSFFWGHRERHTFFARAQKCFFISFWRQRKRCWRIEKSKPTFAFRFQCHSQGSKKKDSALFEWVRGIWEELRGEKMLQKWAPGPKSHIFLPRVGFPKFAASNLGCCALFRFGRRLFFLLSP